MSRTIFKDIHDDWKLVKNVCRTTAGKKFTDNEPSEQFKKAMLICEHSPIRLLTFFWEWDGIKSWIATHWARHMWTPFISTQREDRVNDGLPRDEKPQGAKVLFNGYANMQNCIDTWRKRLCYQASPETRMYAEDFKRTLAETHEAEAAVLVPNCIYRCGCPEFTPCGRWDAFWRWVCHNHADANIFDIQTRYDLYNEWIRGEK